MKRLLFIGIALLWAQGLLAQAEVAFSRPGGFYEESFSLSLSCAGGHNIRYTVNGGTPTAEASLYTEPLLLDEACYSHSDIYTIVNSIPSVFYPVEDVKHAIVVRAAVFDEQEHRVGPVITQTYLIKSLGCNLHGLPVMSINADSLDLFDYETGIFVPGMYYDPADSTHTGNFHQTGREWERRINVEFYEPDNRGLNQQCGLRTHGGASRWFQQKGLKLYARDEYGKKRFNHKFFEHSSIASFKRLILHPFRCSNWLQTGAQEYLAQRVASRLDIDVLGVRQTALFVNGEYWGIYTLEESPDERYLEDHYDVELDEVNVIKWWEVEQYGDITEWWDFYQWMRNEADMLVAADSARAFAQLDMSCFVDYMLFGTFSANLDWPQNNVMLWQAANGEPFRFIFFDGDGCFTNVNYNALDNAIHQGGNSVIFKRLLTSDYFRQLMMDRFLELKETHLSYEAMKPFLEEYRVAVAAEIPDQARRFGFPWHQWRWAADMDTTDAFLRNRCQRFELDLMSFLSVDEQSEMLEFACYPNPSQGSFTLQFTANGNAMMPFEVIDVVGRKVISGSKQVREGVNAFNIETNLPAGLYLVRMGGSVRRIVIE